MRMDLMASCDCVASLWVLAWIESSPGRIVNDNQCHFCGEVSDLLMPQLSSMPYRPVGQCICALPEVLGISSSAVGRADIRLREAYTFRVRNYESQSRVVATVVHTG